MPRFLKIRSILISSVFLAGVLLFAIFTAQFRSGSHPWERLPNRVAALSAAIQKSDRESYDRIISGIINDFENQERVSGDREKDELSEMLARGFDDFDALYQKIGVLSNERFFEAHSLIAAEVAQLPFDNYSVQNRFLDVLRERNADFQTSIQEVFRRAEMAALIERNFSDIYTPTERSFDLTLVKDFKREVLVIFAGRILGASPQAFEEVRQYLISAPGDPLIRIALFDEARELVIDSDRRNALNGIRQEMAGAAADVSDFRAREIISSAEEVVAELSALLSEREGGVDRPVSQGIDRARFHYEQAKNFFESGNFSSAFHQANTAIFIGEDTLLLALTAKSYYNAVIIELKSRLDAVADEISRNGAELMPDFPFSISAIAEDLLRTEADFAENGPTAFVGVAVKRLELLVLSVEEQVYGVR